MELGLIRKIDIDHEMQQSYLDYAMSVIVARALPDARDGLKPVQRRILYAMYDMGLRQDSAYKKSARIVGEVLGKYHPHGDMAVYDAMARMAQDFSMRYMLVDGQGNFGSVDGDPPAAMRYTEARLTSAAMEIINQIEKNTVDFTANFDDTLSEPDVLPAAIPNLLVNGATGIAVGMATNIPPHNLGEVVDALVYMLEQWEKQDDIAVDQLMHFIQGPDFPTGGVIIQDPEGDGLTSAYGTGRGRVIVQARAHLEEMVRGRNRIIVTELPYMTNKSSLIERIAEMAREGTLEGLADLRDESDRQGMRIVIELSKTADPEAILRELYKRTPMQITFGIIMLALVDGEPRLLSLKQALRVYLEHRLTVIRRRSEYDLERARQRAHILEGLRVALQHLDEVISLIRNSPDVDQARLRLMKRFKLSEIQANAILEMPLRRLAALERKKIELEYKDLLAQIKDLEALLRSPKKIRSVAIEELQAIKQAYGDRRRTQIVRLKEGVSAAALLTTTDVTPEQTCWISVSEDGRVSRSGADEEPRLAGRDAPHWLVRATTHHVLYLVSTQGKAAAIPVHSVPEAARIEDGALFTSITPLESADELAAVFALPASRGEEGEERYVFTASRAGMVKKSAVTELPGPSAQAFTLARVNDGDELGWVLLTNGKSELLLATAQGMAIRFSEADVRPMGLVAAGVSGIKLGARDLVVAVEVVPPAGEVFLLASDGDAKRIALKDFPVQGRYGQGVIAWKLAKGVSLAGAMAGDEAAEGVVSYAKAAPRLVRLGDAAQRGRASQGRKLVEVKAGDEILSLYTVWDALSAWSGERDERRQAVKRRPSAPKKAPASARSAGGKETGQPARPSKAVAAPAGAAKTKPDGKTTAGRSRGKAQDREKPVAKASSTSKSKSSGKSPAAKTGRTKTPGAKKPAEKKKPARNKPAGGKPAQKPKSSATKPKSG